MTPEGRRVGAVRSALRYLFGERVELLAERIGHAHPLSYVLICAQSLATVFVFGLAEVTLAGSASLPVRLSALGALALLLITVGAADIAMLGSIPRIPALLRNRQFSSAMEHVAYVAFVLLVETSTYGIVLWALDAHPELLMTGRAFLPSSGPIFITLISLRALLASWTAVQLNIITQELPVQLSTLNTEGRRVIGGHLRQMMRELSLEGLTIADLFPAYRRMAQAPRPVPGLWNALLGGYPMRRALAREAEESRQAQNIHDALLELKAAQVAAQRGGGALLQSALGRAGLGVEPTPGQPITAERAAVKPLGRRDRKREALASGMYGASGESGYQGHPTNPRPTPYGSFSLEEEQDGRDDGRDGGEGADLFDMRYDERQDARRPRLERGTWREEASSARMAPASATLTLPEETLYLDGDDEDDILALANPALGPTPIHPEDSHEGRRIVRYLDRYPQYAQVKELVARLKVSKKTASKWLAVWIERRRQAGSVLPLLTQELPAVRLPDVTSMGERDSRGEEGADVD